MSPLPKTRNEKFSDIETKYKAKIAERKIFLEKNLQDALAQGNQEEAEEARKILAQETLKLEEKSRIRKGKIREST